MGVHFAFNAWGQMNYRVPEGIPATDDWNNVWAYNARWGYQYDQATGYYYCQQRYYDPGNGRWVTRDPIGYAGGVNVYGYCNSNPAYRIDPLGFGTLSLSEELRDEIENLLGLNPSVTPEDAGMVEAMETAFETILEHYGGAPANAVGPGMTAHTGCETLGKGMQQAIGWRERIQREIDDGNGNDDEGIEYGSNTPTEQATRDALDRMRNRGKGKR